MGLLLLWQEAASHTAISFSGKLCYCHTNEKTILKASQFYSYNLKAGKKLHKVKITDLRYPCT